MVPFRRPPVAAAFTHAALVLVKEAIQRGRMLDGEGLAWMEMSSHLFPEYSAHLLGVAPTRHWLEYVTGRRRCSPSLSRSAPGAPSSPPAQGAGSAGTRTRSRGTRRPEEHPGGTTRACGS
jgi:hypothetical protein